MRPLIGIVLFGLIYSGLVWTSENSQLRDHEERQRQEAQKAADIDPALVRKESQSLEENARQIAEERVKKQREMSPEDRKRQQSAIRERLSNLETMSETLGKKLGEDHPQIEAITREVHVLREELQELSSTESPLPKETPEQELAKLREQLGMQLKHQDSLAQTLSKSHPVYLMAQEKTSALQKLVQEKEAAHQMLRDQQSQQDQAARTIEHLRTAAEHLEQAQMPEMARELRLRALDLEREQLGGDSGNADILKQLQEQMRDLRQAIKKLDEEVAGLREQLQKANE